MIVFGYNFPHKKTQDFLFRLLVKGYKPSMVVAANMVSLNIPESSIKSKIRHIGLIHPKEICEQFNIEYLVLDHNSNELESLLESEKPDLGIISGARILKSPIINQFKSGIINFHPGLIPEARGLDALFWSIKNDIQLGVTAHLIDKRIDAGKILAIKHLKVFKDDTLLDLSNRLYEIQLEMIEDSITSAIEGKWQEVNYSETLYNRKMPVEIESEIHNLLPNYLLKYSKI
jgi:phosphoribosylglycinamide formyltransferase-1